MDDSSSSLRVERTAKTLRELSLDKMRDAILGFRFKPGERLVERTLCESLGVSRTVVREVLRHLETEGLVEVIPQQGPAVARTDTAAAEQIYEIRSLLEPMAAEASARLATKQDIARLEKALADIKAAYAAEDSASVLRHSTQFYDALFESAGKLIALTFVKSLNARISHLRALTISSSRRNITGVRELKRIIDAIKKRDSEEARQASFEHVINARDIARRMLQADPDAPKA
jgi:DNA-binding GntR family transcriptional regulator